MSDASCDSELDLHEKQSERKYGKNKDIADISIHMHNRICQATSKALANGLLSVCDEEYVTREKNQQFSQCRNFKIVVRIVMAG